MKSKKQKGIISIVAALALLGGMFVAGMLYASNNPLSLGREAPSDYGEPAPAPEVDTSLLVVRDGETSRGNADVLLIEYSDYECGFCKRFHPTVQALVDSGEVEWVYRHLPLPFHETADEGARLAECVRIHRGGDAFWTYTDGVFASTEPQLSVPVYRRLARESGLSDAQIDSCLEPDSEASRSLDTHMSDAASLGIDGTPGSFLIHKKTGAYQRVPGAVPLESVRELLNQVNND